MANSKKSATRAGKKSASRKPVKKSASKKAASEKEAARKAVREATIQGFRKVVAAIKQHGRKLLDVPGANVSADDVRPGYNFKNGKITKTPAIVVSIHPRDRNAKGKFPKSLGGVPVRVKLMTPEEQVRKAAQLDAGGAESDAVSAPARGSRDIAFPGWDMMQDEEGESDEAGESDVEFDAAPKAVYEPHPEELVRVKEPMHVLCHVSPEEGWKNLSGFFGSAQSAKQNVTIAMYDFTAPHVLKKLSSVMKSSTKEFRLILDPGISLDGDVKVDDVSEEEVRDKLAASSNKFTFLWAAVKKGGKVTQGLFPTAYHIKVAVRGGKSFWLSSGNWQSSNQPNLSDVDLSDNTELARAQKRFNREWHVIVDHPGLAAVYEKFIKRDMKQARPLQAKGGESDFASDDAAAAPLELLVSRDAAEDLGSSVAKRRAFEPGDFKFNADDPLDVQPVLTPDNYKDTVLPVIKSAKKRLYFQNQYIKVGKKPGPDFTALLDAVLGKIKAGLDVKIILRSLPNAADELEALQYYASTKHGIDELPVKHQNGSHTKGIIVDSETVVVGSHNWSVQGVTVNRDASLIFFNPDIAQYYEQVFEHDWQFLAKEKVPSDADMPIVVTAGGGESDEAEGGKLVRVPWDFNEDQS